MRSPVRFPACILALFAAGCAATPPPAPEAPAPAPARAGEPAPPPGAREEADRLRILRGELRSPDPAEALRAACALAPEHLSLEEIRLQCDLLVAHPEEALAGCEGFRSLGSPDVLRLLRTLLDRGAASAFDPGFNTLCDLHRMMVPDHIPGLVDLLEPAEGETFRALLWMLRLLADNSDRHADDVARGLLYARAAMIADLEGSPRPRLAAFAGSRADGPTLALLEATAAPEGPLEGYAFPLPESWVARLRGTAGSPAAEGPEAFTPSAARARIAALRGSGPPAAEDDEGWEAIARDAPLLEAAAPDAMESLLEDWRDAPTGFEEGWVARALAHVRAPQGWRDREDLSDAEGTATAESVARIPLRRPDGAAETLRGLRSDRAPGLYWPATAGLAILGDAGARREFLALLAEDRTFLYDGFFGDPVLLGLNGDPAALAHWRSRIGANCCLWNNADRVLHAWFPTMPCDARVGDFDGTADRAAAWWVRWKGKLHRGRLADGWVPVEEE